MEESLFPNPVNDKYLRLRSPDVEKISEIRLYNYLGQEIAFQTNNYKTQGFDILLDDFKQGLYFLRILSGTESIIKKILIE